jgi:hypothetical protein
LVVQPISSHVPQTGILRIYNPLTGLWDSYGYYSHDDFRFYLSTPLQFNLVGFLGSCPPTQFPGGGIQDTLNYPENWQRWYPSPAYYGGTPGGPLPLPAPWGVIEAPCDRDYCQVSIDKIQEGSPINSVAKPILTEFTEPDSEFSTLIYEVGNLRPNEGFFWWIKRMSEGASCCLRDYFDIHATGNKVSWPLSTGGP